MKVLYVGIGKQPEVKEIDGSLKSMQDLVGGYIQAIPVSYDAELVCDEEGRMKGYPVNRFAFTIDGDVIDLISGNFFIVGAGKDDFVSLTDEQISTYKEMYSSVR